MKNKYLQKALLVLLGVFAIPLFTFSQASGNVDLGSEITNGIMTDGCNASCSPTYCTQTADNSGNHAVETMTLTITGIPAANSAEITFTSINCASTSGLDGGDDIFIDGVQVFDGASNAIVNLTQCVEGGADIVIEFTANRRDELINVSWASGPTDPGAGCFLVAAPVTLTNFTVSPKEKNVSISWTTASEENNDYFSLEHSTDGVNYTEINYAKGAGTSFAQNNYEYTHRNPAKGTNYYRLVQVDYNRSMTYSPVKVIEFVTGDLFTLNPTLAKGEVLLTFNEDFSRNATIEIFDLVGRKIITEQIAGNESNRTIDVSNFQNGHYLVRMQAAGQVQSARFVKF